MPNYKSLPDNELIQLLKESDHSAYNEIYHRYFQLIFTHAYKKLRDEEQAKDIVQDVFATLWFKREENLPTSNLADRLTWFEEPAKQDAPAQESGDEGEIGAELPSLFEHRTPVTLFDHFANQKHSKCADSRGCGLRSV